MVKRVQRVGHITAQADVFIGLQREITVDISTSELRVHDGSTPGGHRILTKEQNDALYQQIGASTFTTLLADDIIEFTGNHGVIIEGVLIKDNLVDTRDVSADWVTSAAHFANVSNPHSTTKSQVGLGAVADALQLVAANNLSDLTNTTTARSNLGVAIGSQVQAFDSDLAAVAGLGTTGILARTGAGAFSTRTITGDANEIVIANGDGVSGAPSIGIVDNPVIPGTGSITVPVGTTGQRPSNAAGKLRWNSSLTELEVANGTDWEQLVGDIDDLVQDLLADSDDWVAGSNAANSNVKFRVPNVGGWSALETQTVDGSTTFNFVLSTYYASMYAFCIFLDHILPTTDAQGILVRTSTDSGGSYDQAANDYVYAQGYISTAAASWDLNGSTTATSFPLHSVTGGNTVGNVANEGLSCFLYIYNPQEAAKRTRLVAEGIEYRNASGTLLVGFCKGERADDEDITNVRFELSGAGTFASGRATLYGIRKTA